MDAVMAAASRLELTALPRLLYHCEWYLYGSTFLTLFDAALSLYRDINCPVMLTNMLNL